MGYKAITYPPKVVLSGNEIPLIVAETDAFITKGNTTKGKIWLQGFHLNGNTITFQYYDKTIVYTCVTDYYGQANAYPVRTSETIQAWGTTLFRILVADYNLSNDFIISCRSLSSSFAIFFEPVTRLAGNNITITAVTTASIETTNSNYTPDVLYQNYKLKLQLLKETVQSDLVSINKFRYPVYPAFVYDGTNAKIEYDLRNLTYDEVDGHFTFPETGLMRSWNIMKKYYMQLSFLADNLTQNSLPPDQFFYVLPGKLSKGKEKDLNTKLTNIYNEIVSKKQFLTFAPLRKQTDIYSPEKLYFLFLDQYNNARLYIEEKYTNNTTARRILNSFPTYAYNLFEFSIGFQQIKLEDYGDLIVKEYDIWIENGSGGMVSEKRTFVLDYNYKRSARYFPFKNSFGVYEILRTTGDAEKIAKNEKEFYERSLFQVKSSDQVRKPININQNLILKINSGLLAKQWAVYYGAEFLSSPDVFWLKSDKKYAVQVEESSESISDSDKINLQSFNFQITVDDIDDSFYSDFGPDILGGDFSDDFSEDFNI